MHAMLFRNDSLMLVGGVCCLVWTCCCPAAEEASAEHVARAEALLKTLDPFYEQHVVADGLLVVGSEKVSQHALQEVAYLARQLLAKRPDVMDKLSGKRRLYASVMAYTEMQNDLPECRGMSAWWNYRARGLGGGSVSCGEENVLQFEGDPWKGENIFIHEFAHGLQGVIAGVDKPFDSRLRELYAKARDSGRFRGYAIEGGVGEFWAEGVQAWFNCNGATRPESGGGQSSFEALGPKGEHVCHLRTRDQVKQHLPEYAELLGKSFGQNAWTYVPIAKRLNQPHLKGFDPAEAPTFRFPPEVVEAFRRHEAEAALNRVLRWAKVSPEQIATAKELGVPVGFENSVGMRFVLIPAGKFRMGSRDSALEVARRCKMPNAQAGWFHDEHPRHEVTLTEPFYMAIGEVSQEHYQAVTDPEQKDPAKRVGHDYPDEFKGARQPVVNIAWNDAERFCKTLTSRSAEQEKGRVYTLPTEAQWEYACRARKDTPFSTGETISTDQANYHGGYVYADGKKGVNRAKTLPCGSLAPNAWGLHDMHGNVSEWCADRYDDYDRTAQTDPTGPTEGTNERVLRGGSWRSYPGACRASFRHRGHGNRSHKIGFRVCCPVPKRTGG